MLPNVAAPVVASRAIAVVQLDPFGDTLKLKLSLPLRPIWARPENPSSKMSDAVSALEAALLTVTLKFVAPLNSALGP